MRQYFIQAGDIPLFLGILFMLGLFIYGSIKGMLIIFRHGDEILDEFYREEYKKIKPVSWKKKYEKN